jgi:uncharacterized protein YqgV (UPF0045/DUF77 family)
VIPYDCSISIEIANENLAPEKTVDQSKLRYCLTPLGTCIEGNWDEVMPLVKRQARGLSGHVMTTIRIEDEEAATDKLNENIASVERAAGCRLRRC